MAELVTLDAVARSIKRGDQRRYDADNRRVVRFALTASNDLPRTRPPAG